MWRAMWAVIRKEVKDTLRDRRSVTSSLLTGPLLVPLLFVGGLSLSLGRAVDQMDQPTPITVVGAEHAPNLVAALAEAGMVIERRDGSEADVERWIRDREEQVVVRITPEYGTKLRAAEPAPLQLFADGADTKADKAADRVRAALQAQSSSIGMRRLQARGVSPTVVQAIAIEDVDVSTPSGRAALILGMLTYLFLLVGLMGGLYIAIDATAGERERGSLEPLLTAPVPREHLIYGKILATVVFMVIALAVCVAVTSQSIRMIPLEKIGMSANFGPAEALKVFVTTLPFLPVGAALLTCVAAFTRTFKEAQTYLSMVLLVPTLPIVVAAVMEVQPTLPLMLVPSLSQHLLIQGVLRAEPLPWLYVAVSAGSSLLLALALSWLAGRLYRRESLLG